MDWPVIEQKLESLRRSLRRVEEKCPKDADALEKDVDAQDSLTRGRRCSARAADCRDGP